MDFAIDPIKFSWTYNLKSFSIPLQHNGEWSCLAIVFVTHAHLKYRTKRATSKTVIPDSDPDSDPESDE